MNILLDLDGTLTDSRDGIVRCIQHALTTLGRTAPPDHELVALIGAPLRDAFAQLLHTDGPLADDALAAYRDRYRTLGMFENLVYDGVPEALGSLAGTSTRLYLATAKPQVFAKRILEHFGLDRHFSAIHGSELDGTRTDKRELIAHILREAALDPADTIMVGDRHHDMRGAIGNGVMPVGVLWGYGSRGELEQAGARHLVESPADLLRFRYREEQEEEA